MIKLYHGSNVIITEIDLTQCNPYKDFGQAFYLTKEQNQALDIANARVDIFGGEPVINVFCFDESLLIDGTLTFKSFDGYTEEWADFIYQHRDETIVRPRLSHPARHLRTAAELCGGRSPRLDAVPVRRTREIS